jgi:hypothetical protein
MTPPAAAVAVNVRHAAGSIESHVAKLTTLNVDGFTAITGEGSVSESRASFANVTTETPAGSVAGGAPDSIHVRAPVKIVSFFPGHET